MDIRLKPVTRDNWEEALLLRVTEEQAKFVPTVAVSLAKVSIKPDGDQVEYLPFAIYDGERIVGFIMHAFEADTRDSFWINGFLIDARFQGRGYGKAAFATMLRHIQKRSPQCMEIRLTVHPANATARRLYEGFGFRDTGKLFGDEMLYRLPLAKEQLCLERVSELFTTELQHLVTEATAEGHLFMQRLVEEYEYGKNRFDKAGEALFVARLDERIVGVCGLNLDPYERDPDVGRVRHLFVEQSVRKMGIARALVSEVVREAANHYRVLLLRTRNPEADQLYRSLGFSTATVYHHATHQMRFTR